MEDIVDIDGRPKLETGPLLDGLPQTTAEAAHQLVERFAISVAGAVDEFLNVGLSDHFCDHYCLHVTLYSRGEGLICREIFKKVTRFRQPLYSEGLRQGTATGLPL